MRERHRRELSWRCGLGFILLLPTRLRRNLKRRQRLALRPSRPNRVISYLLQKPFFFFSVFLLSSSIHEAFETLLSQVTSRQLADEALRIQLPTPVPSGRYGDIVIFLSFYSSSDTCPQYLSAANTSCSGARSPPRSMEKRVPQSTKRATGAPSAVLAYGVGLIPHLFVSILLY
ncbi:hypothetical protein HDV63DRAFT_12695 [Trichoderma sp. SZMC 28014]